MDVRLEAPVGDTPDTVLIRRFLQGDEQAFRALYRRHTPRLRMVMLRLLGQREADADDVVQETWLAACRGIHAFRGDARFGTWLTTIGIRTARVRLSVHDVEDQDPVAIDLAASNSNGAGENIDMERALSRLSDQQRVVIVLHDIEGFTHEEIAGQLGVATGTSKATLSRARAALRRYLNAGVPKWP